MLLLLFQQAAKDTAANNAALDSNTFFFMLSPPSFQLLFKTLLVYNEKTAFTITILLLTCTILLSLETVTNFIFQ